MGLTSFFRIIEKGGPGSGRYPKGSGSHTSTYPGELTNFISGKNVDKKGLEKIDELAMNSETKAKELYRVVRNDPDLSKGDIFSFNKPESTTKTNLLEKDAGHIAIKYTDDALFIIKNPSIGLDVNYKKVGMTGVSPQEENETIVSGKTKYRISNVRSIPHPAKNSGKFLIYELNET